MKRYITVFVNTVLYGSFAVGAALSVHASIDLLGGSGDFSISSGSSSGGGLASPNYTSGVTVSGWSNPNNGYTFVWTQSSINSATKVNGPAGALSLYNSNNGGAQNILTAGSAAGDLPASYTGNIIGADGGYQVGALESSPFSVVANQQYKVSFYYAAAQQSGFPNQQTSAQFTVGLGTSGNLYSSGTTTTPLVYEPGNSSSAWSSYSATFTAAASSSSEVLSFLSYGTPSGVPPFSLLADVTLDSVPEPSTVFAGCLMLLPLGFTVVRYFRKANAKAA